MEEDLHERPLYRRLGGLEGAARMPDESTILLEGSAGMIAPAAHQKACAERHNGPNLAA